MSSGFNVIRRHSLDATGIRIKELTQALATNRSKLEGSQLETDDVRSQGRMDHSTIKLNDERLSFATVLNSSNTDFYYEFPNEPDLQYLKVWLMLDHLGARVRDISGFGNDAYVSGHPTLRRALLDLGFQQLPSAPATPVMLFNSGTDAVSKTDGEYIWIPDNDSIQFTNYPNGFSIHFRFCCLNFAQHHTDAGGIYSRRFASKTDDVNNGWSVLVNDTGNNTGGIEFNILHNGIQYSRKTNGYNAGMWYQVVITYDPTAGSISQERIKIYTAAQENSTDSDFDILLSTTNNLRIGARSSGTGFFYGYIHDFRLWMGKVLTQEEITNISDNELTIDNIPKGHIFVVQYALVQAPLASKRHKWNVVGKITKVKIHRFNVITIISLTKTHKWNEFERILPIRVHKYNIVEMVKRLLSIVYDQGGRLLKSKTHKYNMEGRISRTHTHKYNVTSSSQVLTTQYKRFQKSTTSGSNVVQEVTYDSTPQAIIVWTTNQTADNSFTNGYNQYYGFSDGTRNCCISGFATDNVATTYTFGGIKTDKAISVCTVAGTVVYEGTVTFGNSKATFTWTTNNTTAAYIHTMAIWGATAAEVIPLTVDTVSTGNYTYYLNNSSMTPNLIHTITASSPSGWSTAYGVSLGIGAATTSNEFCINNTSDDANTGSNCQTAYTTSSCLVEYDDDMVSGLESSASLDSFGAGEFTLNWTDAPPSSARVFGVLAIQSANIGIGTITQPNGVTGTQVYSTPTNVDTVKGLMMYNNSQTAAGVYTVSPISIGAASGTGATEQGLTVTRENDGANPTVSVRQNKTGSITKTITAAATATSSTTTTEAAVSALGTDQFTLNWTVADANTRKFHYIALGA